MAEVDSEVLGKYDIQKRIGKGAYGIVWKAVERASLRTVAVKKIFDAFRNKTDAQRTFREVVFLREFGRHPGIVRLLDVMRADNDLDLYLVLEYMDSDLHEVIRRGDLLKDVHKSYIMFQLLDAIHYLHSASVIHRDLKPSNILINVDCHIRVADFGLARLINQSEDEDSGDPLLTEYVATRWYRAPEILLADKWYTTGVDMWSIGCILGEMLLGQPLFPGTSTLNQIERIMTAITPPTNQDIRSMCSGYALTLLERASNRPKRPLWNMVPSAPDDAIDLLVQLLIFSPTKRLSADQALAHSYVKRFSRMHSELAGSIRRGSISVEDDGQPTVDGYRNRLYRVSRPTYSSFDESSSEMINENWWCDTSHERDNFTEEPTDVKTVMTACQVEDGGSPTTSVRSELEENELLSTEDVSVPRGAVGKWVSPSESKSAFRSRKSGRSDLRKAQSHESVCSSDDPSVSPPVRSKQSSPPVETYKSGTAFRPAAGLPSCHPRANTASAWLRYHSPIIVSPDLSPKTTRRRRDVSQTPPAMATISSGDRPKPSFGRRQFGNYSNVSSVGCPKTALHSYAQNHGTIAASAFRQLRLGN